MTIGTIDLARSVERELANERGKVARMSNNLRIVKANAANTEGALARLKATHRTLQNAYTAAIQRNLELERERDELRRKYNAVQSVHNPAVRRVKTTEDH